MTKIHILPDYIANQIAAGEVVQKPESIVKELVENSIDSGANSIVVVVKGAGKKLIHVVDNGTGMSKEDLILAPRRHATSKILSAKDLEAINSFGFRGEALASISAVASLEIRTKRDGDPIGWSLVSEPNSEAQVTSINCDKGTQVIVRNLFFNVPARKKFLKSDLTEFRYISDTMIKFAISHPDIRFIFYDNETMIFDLYPQPIEKRIISVIGNSLDGNLLPINYFDDKVSINGFIGLPHLAKAATSNQYLFLNKRSIISKNLSYAVYSAFEHLLEKNHKPFFVINISIDPDHVDVNVHPQKHEVKFDDDRYIFSVIRNSVVETLTHYNLTPEHHLLKVQSEMPYQKITSGEDEGKLLNKITGEIIDPKQHSFPKTTFSHNSFANPFKLQEDNDIFNNNIHQQNTRQITAFEALFGAAAPRFETADADKMTRISIAEDTEYFQIHNKYILLQTNIGLLIVDQHNAHERIIFERARDAFSNVLANSQALVFPIISNLSPSQIAVIREITQELNDLGFVFQLQENTIEISSIPLEISETDAAMSFLDIIDDFSENQTNKFANKRDGLSASFACKSAIKTGKKLSREEMRSLVNKLLNCSMPYVCPHGRPIIIEITSTELDRSFKRI